MRSLGCAFAASLALAAPLGHAAPIETLQPSPQLLPNVSGLRSSDYRAGVSALKQGDFAKAREAFERAVKADPKTPAPLIGLAEIALREKKPSEAERHLRQALDLAPQDSALQLVWGKFLLGQGRNEEARAAFAKAVALDPKAVRPRVDLGDFHLFVLKQPQQAAEVYKEALAQEPENVGILVALAKAQHLANQLDDARATIERAAALAPANPLPLMVAAEIEAQRGRNDAALAAYDRAIAAAPQFVQSRLAKAALLLRLGRKGEALTEYGNVLKHDPGNVSALVSQGVLMAQAKRPEEAEKSFAAAVRANPQVPRILNDVAWQEVERKGDLDRALILAREAVSAAPDIAAYRDTLGWVHRARGELKEAEAALTKAAAGSTAPDVLTHLATARAELGDNEGAAEALHRALSFDPNYAPALELRRQLPSTR